MYKRFKSLLWPCDKSLLSLANNKLTKCILHSLNSRYSIHEKPKRCTVLTLVVLPFFTFSLTLGLVAKHYESSHVCSCTFVFIIWWPHSYKKPTKESFIILTLYFRVSLVVCGHQCPLTLCHRARGYFRSKCCINGRPMTAPREPFSCTHPLPSSRLCRSQVASSVFSSLQFQSSVFFQDPVPTETRDQPTSISGALYPLGQGWANIFYGGPHWRELHILHFSTIYVYKFVLFCFTLTL